MVILRLYAGLSSCLPLAGAEFCFGGKLALPTSPTTHNTQTKRHLQNHQHLMILLKLVSSDAANGEYVSALRFLTVPKAAPVLTWTLYQIWPSDTIRLISLEALRRRKQSEGVGWGFKVSWEGQPPWAQCLHGFQGPSVLERNVMGSKIRRENNKSKLIFISNTKL